MQADGLAPAQVLTGLKTGGYVILMRHASSPSARPDKSGADPENTHLERQLDEAGRTSAQAMGEAIRRLKIPIGKVLSSPTYRALETVKLAGFGAAVTAQQLGDSGQSMTRDDSGTRDGWLRQRCAEPPATGTNTLIVTHSPNITEAYPQDASQLREGEALIIHPDGKGSAPVVTRVQISDWPTFP